MRVITYVARIYCEWLCYKVFKMSRERSRTAETLGEIILLREDDYK